MNPKKIKEGVELILDGLGVDLKDPNFVDTPERVTRMYQEILDGLTTTKQDLKQILSSVFPSKNKEMIICAHMKEYSLCPHHLLTVELDVSVAYVPTDKVLGISKIPRLVRVLAHKPLLQEDFTEEVADILTSMVQPLGVAVLVRGQHSCMKIRGVKSTGSMITSALRGIFLTNDKGAKDEFLRLISIHSEMGQ